MPAMFIPATPEFVKKHAKQISKAFPGLPLSTAQEATARALGFSDYFDCIARLERTRACRSEVDEAVDASTRRRRRYTQIRALVDFAGLPPCEVDEFVRRWQLTSESPSTLSAFSTIFTEMNSELRELESGRLSREQFNELYQGTDGTPYRLAEGIIHGPAGLKHTHYVLSTPRIRAIPWYLRGNASVFIDFDDGYVIFLSFPDEFLDIEEVRRESEIRLLARIQPWLYEWHTGTPAPDFGGTTLKQMEEVAAKSPDGWFAISCRFSRVDSLSAREIGIPALRGSDFVRFIRNKGSLLGLDLQWFTFINQQEACRFSQIRVAANDRTLPIFLDSGEIIPIEPMYGSPFKHGPMSDIEFNLTLEGAGMLLVDELEDDNEYDEEGGV